MGRLQPAKCRRVVCGPAEAAAADPATADQAVAHFTALLERFGQSPKAPEALRKLAGLAQQQGKMQEAIGYYERVLAEYPASEHGDEAQFMIAFIYEGVYPRP